MTAWRFTNNGHIIRRVAVDPDGTISVDDTPNLWIGVQWVKTGRSLSGVDRTSPRRERTDLLRYRNGVLLPAGGPLGAGDRVELDGAGYEVLEDSRSVRVGRRTVSLEVPIQAVNLLYPLEGAIAQQGGAPVEPSVRFSVYSADESHDTTGTYEDYVAETDISHHSEVGINRQLVSDGNIYKIISAENDLVGRFVRMAVRKSGG